MRFACLDRQGDAAAAALHLNALLSDGSRQQPRGIAKAARAQLADVLVVQHCAGPPRGVAPALRDCVAGLEQALDGSRDYHLDVASEVLRSLTGEPVVSHGLAAAAPVFAAWVEHLRRQEQLKSN